MNIYDTSAYLKMKRSKMDITKKHKTSIPFGKLVPIGGAPLDVLPGDTIRLDYASIIRMLTPLAPLMDDISGDLYFFFVPWRLVWSKTKQFFGENDMVAWTLPQNVNIPHIGLRSGAGSGATCFAPSTTTDIQWGTSDSIWRLNSNNEVIDSRFKGTLIDYFGLPYVWMTPNQVSTFGTDYDGAVASFDDVNALYFRGYQLIWNEFFRKDAIQDPKTTYLYDGSDIVVTCNPFNIKQFFDVLPVCRWNDLYSSLLPSPQRGPEMTLPLGTSKIPVDLIPSSERSYPTNTPFFEKIDGSLISGGYFFGNGSPATGQTATSISIGTTSSSNNYFVASDKNLYFNPKGSLYVNLANSASITVNQLRMIVATQRYYEALARGSARYSSYLEEMFGVRPSDAVLQRPQFLGGHHFNINVAQVLSQAETSGAPIGQTGAYSATGVKGHMFTNSFQEHGFIMSFIVLRKEHTYCQGKDIEWEKRELFDVYNPKFAHIGEVGVKKTSVYWTPKLGDTLLGFNEPWYEYRSAPSVASGLLNPLHANSLSYYALTDVLESEPYLDDKFVEEDSNGLDSALVASASVTDQFFGDFRLNFTCSRVMPVKSVPGLMDHF